MLDNPNRHQTGSCKAKTSVGDSGAFESFANVNSTAAYATRCNQSAIKASGDIAQSWLQFLEDRWTKDLAFPQAVANCKTANDFCVAYSEFLQEAAKDYSAEFNTIADAAWAATRTTLDFTDDAGASRCCQNCGNKRSSS